MSYTPKQPGAGAGGSGGGQNAQQKTLVQQMQDAAHNMDAFTQAISSSQAFPNLNMSRQQQQQTQQRLDLYMKQQQFIFSNTQIQQLQQQIQQHIQQNATIEPLALTRGQNQQQQANGNTAASVLANQQLQLQQAYAANPAANLMQQLQAYQFQMQQQQQQKMMPMNQAQQSLTSTFQAQNAAFQQQQKFLAAAAAAQNKSIAAMNQQKGSNQMANQSSGAQQASSNNNLPNKSPARLSGTSVNFPKIPATIQATSVKAPQTSQSPPVVKQATTTGSSAPKASSINVPGNVTITKASTTPMKLPQSSPVHHVKSVPNPPSSLTITKSVVASSSLPLSPSPNKSNAVNSTQSQSPKPAVTATTATVITPTASTTLVPKPLQPKEVSVKTDPKPELSPPVAKDAPKPQQTVTAEESDPSLSATLSASQEQKQSKEDPPAALPSISAAITSVPAPTPTPPQITAPATTPAPASITDPAPITAPEKVPEEKLSNMKEQQKPEAEKSEGNKALDADSKATEEEKSSDEKDGANVVTDSKSKPIAVSEAATVEESTATEPAKITTKVKPVAIQKKSTSPAKSETSAIANDISKPADKKKNLGVSSPSQEISPKAAAPPAVVKEPSSAPSTSIPDLTKVDNLETSKSNDSRRSRRHRLKTIPFQSPLPELAYITKLSVAEATASSSPKQTEDKLTLFYKNEYLAVRNAESGFFICQTLQNVFRSSPKIRIRWLSEEKKEENVYIPDFYDTTDIECVLTTVEMEKVGKDRWRIPKAEKVRIENILKKAIDVEKGLAPRPEVTEENPDGLDISLYKNESQIEKRRYEAKQDDENSLRKSSKRASTERSKSKSPKKKRKTKTRKSTRGVINATDLTESNESEDETDTDKEYKPKKKSVVSQAKVARAQRSPLARARAASPIIIRKDNALKPKSTTVPNKESAPDSTPSSSISRSDRAKRRGGLEDKANEIPAKKPLTTHSAPRNALIKSASYDKATKSSDEELLVPLPERTAPTNTNNKTSSIKKNLQKPTTVVASSTSDVASSSTPTKSCPNRTTRSRK